jgi:hypothetical protein
LKLDITAMGFIEGDQRAVQNGLAQYAAAGAGRFAVAVPRQLKPDNYEAELVRLASIYV